MRFDPWQEAGETWRRLAVTFPPSNANHNPDQIFYYDEKYMQRRMVYSPSVGHRSPTTPMTTRPSTASSSPPDVSPAAATNMGSPTNHLR